MDQLQNELVRVGLESLDRYGFALAGGYALQAHGLIDRMSDDVDLFTDRWDPADFTQAVDVVLAAYSRSGLETEVVRRAKTFVRIRATDPHTGAVGEVDLAADSRHHEPARLEFSSAPFLQRLTLSRRRSQRSSVEERPATTSTLQAFSRADVTPRKI